MIARAAGIGGIASGARAGAAPLRAAATAWLEEAARRARSEPEWLVARRRTAADRFREHGFPSPHEEAWRLTPIDRLLDAPPFAACERTASHTAGDELQRARLLVPEAALRVALVDGWRQDDKSPSVSG